MQIKRFEAKDMTAALALIKQEFGPDAVILSAKSLRSYGMLGGAKTTGVEVTAAIDPGAAGRTAQTARTAREAGDDVVTLSMAAARRRTGGRLMTSIGTGITGLRGRMGRSPAPETAPSPAATPDDGRFRRYLEGQGINRVLAEKCAGRMGAAPAEALARALEGEGVRVRSARPAAPAIMVFVGPSGVGKTTTVIKLATRMAVDEGRIVGLVTMDHQRIGAVEQMQLYADILQVPMAPVFDARSLRQALSDLSACEVVLVDTPGIAPSDAPAVAALQQSIRSARQAEVHLVVSAGSKEEDLDRILEGFSPLCAGALVATKFDESVCCGNVVNLLHRSRMPLSFVSDGGQIPEDLHEGSTAWLARRLVANYTPAAAAPGPVSPQRRVLPRAPRAAGAGAQPFVANSNSDIFHRTDCKWTKMIKSENFISFESMGEALSQGFNPCRYCKPTPSASDERMLPEAGVGHMAGYR